LKLASSKAYYEDVADEIYRLREEKQNVQLESAGRDELRKRMADMGFRAGAANYHCQLWRAACPEAD
jgi:hypothetical protein